MSGCPVGGHPAIKLPARRPDAASGTVRLKKKVDDADEMALDTRSTKTVRTKK